MVQRQPKPVGRRDVTLLYSHFWPTIPGYCQLLVMARGILFPHLPHYLNCQLPPVKYVLVDPVTPRLRHLVDHHLTCYMLVAFSKPWH